MRDRVGPALVAEGVGTFLFLFVGAGSVVVAGRAVLLGGTDPGLVSVALAHGLALAVLVSALGAISGAHLNPAVTLAVWLSGRIALPLAGLYVVAQLVGALAAGFALRAIFDAESAAASALGTPRWAQASRRWRASPWRRCSPCCSSSPYSARRSTGARRAWAAWPSASRSPPTS